MATAPPSFPGQGRRLDEFGQFQAPNIIRQSPPEILPLPSLTDMQALSDAELRALLERYGILPPWSAVVAGAQKTSAAWVTMPQSWNRAEFERRLAELLSLAPRTDGAPSRELLGLARRTQERYTTVEALDGNANAELVRIAEEDDATCAGCFDRSGELGTYAYHQSIGLPGEQECGYNCRCQLIRVD